METAMEHAQGHVGAEEKAAEEEGVEDSKEKYIRQ